MPSTVVQRIQAANQGRDRDRLRLKYDKLQSDPFSFLRGTCHLFYEDWPAHTPLNQAPLAWICGDLHLENFGSYKGDDRQVYFDINDFDEAVLAPCTWDLARLLTSIIVAAHSLNLTTDDVETLCDRYLTAYTDALTTGKARSVHTETASGMVEDLLERLQQRDRTAFLDQRTTVVNGRRNIVIDGDKTYDISEAERSALTLFMANWAAKQPDPEFFELLDMAGRIAGNSSLGLKRYLLLIEGKGSPDRNYLLDLKQIAPSALSPYLPQPQPIWDNPAARVVAIQTRVQAIAPALLHADHLGSIPVVLKELQPSQDRLELSKWNGKLKRLETVIQTMGAITAWGQLRSSGRQGSAIADELIAFGQDPSWQKDLLAYAYAYGAQVEADYAEFCHSVKN